MRRHAPWGPSPHCSRGAGGEETQNAERSRRPKGKPRHWRIFAWVWNSARIGEHRHSTRPRRAAASRKASFSPPTKKAARRIAPASGVEESTDTLNSLSARATVSCFRPGTTSEHRPSKRRQPVSRHYSDPGMPGNRKANRMLALYLIFSAAACATNDALAVMLRCAGISKDPDTLHRPHPQSPTTPSRTRTAGHTGRASPASHATLDPTGSISANIARTHGEHIGALISLRSSMVAGEHGGVGNGPGSRWAAHVHAGGLRQATERCAMGNRTGPCGACMPWGPRGKGPAKSCNPSA